MVHQPNWNNQGQGDRFRYASYQNFLWCVAKVHTYFAGLIFKKIKLKWKVKSKNAYGISSSDVNMVLNLVEIID